MKKKIAKIIKITLITFVFTFNGSFNTKTMNVQINPIVIIK